MSHVLGLTMMHCSCHINCDGYTTNVQVISKAILTVINVSDFVRHLIVFIYDNSFRSKSFF